MKLFSSNGKRDTAKEPARDHNSETILPPITTSEIGHVRPITADAAAVPPVQPEPQAVQAVPPVQPEPQATPPQAVLPIQPEPPVQPIPAPQPAPALDDIMQYPDEMYFTEEQERAIQMAKEGRLTGSAALTAVLPEHGYAHLEPPKRSAGKIVLIVLFTILLVGAAGLGGFYFWWTEYATFEYELQPVVILDGQGVRPEDFLPEAEIARGVAAAFQNPDFTPYPGPIIVPLSLRLGLRSVEAEATLYVLMPELQITHEYKEEAADLAPIDFITNAGIARGTSFDVAFIEPPLPLGEYDVGEYTLRLSLNGVPFDVNLTVEDTTPPTATPESVVVEIGDTVTPEDFISDVYDHSGIASIAFIGDNEGEPLIAAYQDNQIIEVEVIDKQGNAQQFAGSLVVLRNQTPPALLGVPPVIESMVDRPIAYPEDITAHDDFGRDIGYFADDAHIDTSVMGEYEVLVIAEDFTGLRTEIEVVVFIIDIDPIEVDIWVNEKLAEIITPEMTQKEKVRAIWNAVRKAVSTSTNTNTEWTGSVYSAAHYAITNSRGDYYHFYSLSEIMLTRAGIANMRIERSEDSKIKKPHFWNLVYYDDEGWYHYDSMRVSDWTAINNLQPMFTDKDIAELERQMTYARVGGDGYYDYDITKYPIIVSGKDD